MFNWPWASKNEGPTAPLSYLDLVIAVVRGHTPIPEYQALDRSEQGKAYVKELRDKYRGRSTGSALADGVLALGGPFLVRSWHKLSPPALSMCGDESIRHLVEAMHTLVDEDIPGDFIEAGVWRGGLPIIMRAFLQQVGDKQRKVYLADSFQGLPREVSDPRDQAANILLESMQGLAVQRQQVEAGFDFFGLKDEQVVFLEGWFSDTLPSLRSPLALVRLDGDYYESTRDAIEALYPLLSDGGFLIVDDYNLPLGARRAIDDYRDAHGIDAPIVPINKQAVYWRKR